MACVLLVSFKMPGTLYLVQMRLRVWIWPDRQVMTAFVLNEIVEFVSYVIWEIERNADQ